MSFTPELFPSEDGQYFHLKSPTLMPRASGFLWNKKMMIQMNCRGYAVSQFMQPEPAKYAYAPNLEAKTFMQPEQPYYAHHPGRFFYLKDEDSGEIFSAPYEPVRAKGCDYTFSPGKNDIQWTLRFGDIEVHVELSLPVDDAVELWQFSVKNTGASTRNLSLYPYFTPGYMSWMNQSAQYDPALGAIVASCVTPYQKYPDYFKNQHFKDKTYLLHERPPVAWQTQREAFEGEGGLHNPDALQADTLACDDARYETPLAALQYRVSLPENQCETYRFAFGPAKDENEIALIKERYLSAEKFQQAKQAYGQYVASGSGVLHIETPDEGLNNFVNHWLARQVFYHGDVNRLTTDPQTRNYLQDNMGMSYIKPATARHAFTHALGQQEASGAMPDGILLHEDAELKYINQVPHTDHCVWLPVCLKAYLDETGDLALLNEPVKGVDGKTLSVAQRISNAMQWLLDSRDERGLSYIAQGDWCDPMNMVGYKGRGVSGWLSIATAYALNVWADICERSSIDNPQNFRTSADEINASVNKHLWDGNWYGRGITDDNVVFGISQDSEGRIFLNPQSWAILAGTCSPEQREKMLQAVEQQLETPYGVTMLAPAFTAMREDVGRVTQKHPGSAENGSVYNHAAIFYIYSLYSIGESDRAYKLLRQMIPGPSSDDFAQRGQMPIYIPNYYRGAYYQFPRTAGRSSQLFNTGTVSWVYRSLVEGLLGLKGDNDDLLVEPKLPTSWDNAKVTRHFRGATVHVHYQKGEGASVLIVDGEPQADFRLRAPTAGKEYNLKMYIGSD
ncbi:GH36-type glycosyl hydrolase domain-containing protein [Gilvimarinus sp. 1_MG-2023]|uniref:GH36-type glycosyl hydrolase domain-containing protein n=1 Tax=Gilvimarinus sp. 1_MG-2023 TaxID=3062638 RepID=UPI0026E37700|nr:amylo-alpha-1,6-glucosidase [Gilvimarinus sp. 1_MG-2023]MDO6747865.1 amylo-alpha-1,6-glucosidase [Gilvimarinus sp. 1_MG-2023]